MSSNTETGSPQTLKKTIGLYGAVSLALGIVLGAGMLSLPGLVYRESGGWAVFAWLLDAALVVPLLFVFAALGRRFPSAGGVAGFVGQAFPGLKVGCSYLLVGTFALGLPAIAITGAGYLAAFFDGAAADNGRAVIAGISFAIIGLVLVVAWFGARLAGVIQNIIVTLLLASIFVATATSVPYWPTVDLTAGAPEWSGLWSGMGLAFFAYTGWEMLAFTAEEFRNPRRDFPIAVAVSFVLVLFLYAGVALAVQALVPLGDPELLTAPLMAIVNVTLPSAYTGPLLAAVVAAIILTNLNGAVWAASRLLFDLGRSGAAPAVLKLHALEGRDSIPRPAVAALGILLAAVLLGYGLGFWNLSDLLRYAGQNFFLLYTLSIVAFVRIAEGTGKKAFGYLSLAVCLVFAGTFDWGLIYAGVLFLLPYALVQTKRVAVYLGMLPRGRPKLTPAAE